MKSTTALLMASGLVLAGCASAPPAGTVRANSCLQPDTKAMTCEPKGNNLICPVYVYNTPAGIVVYPYTLVVPAREKARIVWHLIEPRTEFLDRDGPQELKRESEFENGGSTDDADGDGAVRPKGKKYRFHYKNSQPGKTFNYTIKFRSTSGTEFFCDPAITNLSN
jgi:hypothetical protein